MLNNLDILIKSITLLHRENELSQLDGSSNDNSRELVKTVISYNKNEKKPLLGGESTVLDDITSLLDDMIHNPNNYDKLSLLQSLELILKDHSSILKIIDKNINIEMSVPGLKKSIISLRNALNTYYKQQELRSMINKANYLITTNRIEEPLPEFISKLVLNLEALMATSKTKDPGIVDEIDINDDESMLEATKKIKAQNEGTGRYKTGWKEMNDMLGGGFIPGETVLTSALQHNYKSGLIQSLFAQLPMYNKPTLKDQNKRPLNLLISFEDNTDIIVNFIFRYLYFSENRVLPDVNGFDIQHITSYVKERLTRNGFYIKIIRVNPSEWTYKSMFNKILEYEANGYELKMLFIDYLAKLPTTGCDTSGPMGTAVRDLLDRVRQFCSAKGITLFVPHQLSTEAKQLTRNGVAAKDFVKEIANKGYYEGSKQLDQIVDLEIHQHIAKIKGQYYLTFQRGKRRYPEIIDDDKKYFMLPFPYKAPIPPNINLEGEYIGFDYTDDKSKVLDANTDEEDYF
ncbi:DnaB family ATPase [Campylobacter coli]